MRDREPEMVRGIEGWRDWTEEESIEDLNRRTNEREIDRRHQWNRGRPERWRRGEGYGAWQGEPRRSAWESWRPGRYGGGPQGWGGGRWRSRAPDFWEAHHPWESPEPGRRGFGGYGAGPYGGSYGGFGPGEADMYPPSGVEGGLSGAGSLTGSYGLAPGWRSERMRMREEGWGRRPRWRREGPLVRDLMTRDPKVVGPDASVRDAARLMREEDAGIIPVCLDGRILGVVTDRDLTVRVLANGRDPSMVRVSEVMSGDVQVATPDDVLLDALEIMGEEHVRRLPVVDRDDRIIGILSMSDVAREAEVDYALQEALDQIASRRSFWSRW